MRFDRGSRAMCASDGSNYRQVPIGLVIPRDDNDVLATIALCRSTRRRCFREGPARASPARAATWRSFSIFEVHEPHPRGRYGNRFARVQPGVSRYASRAPSATSSPSALTFDAQPLHVGGMIGNNSCGTHSLLAGKTVDNIHTPASCFTTARSSRLGGRLMTSSKRSFVQADDGRHLRPAQSHSRSVCRTDPRTLSRHSAAGLRLQPRSAAAGKRVQRAMAHSSAARAPAPSSSKRKRDSLRAGSTGRSSRSIRRRTRRPITSPICSS